MRGRSQRQHRACSLLGALLGHQPLRVVALLELQQSTLQAEDGLELLYPGTLLREGADDALGHSVAFGWRT